MSRSRAVMLLILILAAPARAQIQVAGDRLTATTDNLIVTFKNGDIVRLLNRRTGDIFVNTLTPLRSMISLGVLESTPQPPLRPSEWRQGKAQGANPNAAQTTWTDLQRMIWMNVVIDEETQDVVITIWGEAKRDDITGLTFGLRGLDLSTGSLILPALGGAELDRKTAPQRLSLGFPSEWQAQLFIFQGRLGGFILYSRDADSHYKRLSLTRRGDYADIGFESEAPGPWTRASGVPMAEWRINAYKGDWTVPATGYRALMDFLRKPVEARGDRAWAKEIAAVRIVRGSRPDPAALPALAREEERKQTLLFLRDWREDQSRSADAIRSYIEKAHAMGYRVMLPVSLGIAPDDPDYPRVERFHARDPRSGTPITYPSVKLAALNPASSAVRALILSRLHAVVQELEPDALHLEGAGFVVNDGNGKIENKTFLQGSASLLRALLTALPSIALSVDSVNEVIAPYVQLAKLPTVGSLAPHPLNTFLFTGRIHFWEETPEASPAH